jgi:hypothetical protein
MPSYHAISCSLIGIQLPIPKSWQGYGVKVKRNHALSIDSSAVKPSKNQSYGDRSSRSISSFITTILFLSHSLYLSQNSLMNVIHHLPSSYNNNDCNQLLNPPSNDDEHIEQIISNLIFMTPDIDIDSKSFLQLSSEKIREMVLPQWSYHTSDHPGHEEPIHDNILHETFLHLKQLNLLVRRNSMLSNIS